MRRGLLVYTLLMVASVAHATDADDRLVEQAVRASLLGDTEQVHTIARTRLYDERAMKKNGEEFQPLAENVAALSLATRRPAPTLHEVKQAFHELGSDQMTKNVDRLVRINEPRQRFREARKETRYEVVRRLFNSVTIPIANALQGQFFSLFSAPFDAIDYLTVGRLYLTPEERRELYTARLVNNKSFEGGTARAAETIVRNKEKDRVRTAALEARTNGARAQKKGDEQIASFWYDRERALKKWERPHRDGHRAALKAITDQEIARSQSLTVVDGDILFYSPAEFAATQAIIEDLLLDRAIGEESREFSVSFPSSAARDDVAAAEVASARQHGDDALATVLLDDLAASSDESPWRSRAIALEERPTYSPETALSEALDEARARKFSFFLTGADPRASTRSLSAEEARTNRSIWTDKARGLFFTDTASRLLAWPFLPPFSRHELLDTAQEVDPDFFKSERGEAWLRELQTAYVADERFRDASLVATKRGDAGDALKYERKAARQLEKAGDGAPPSQALLFYRRLLSAYPSYARRDRVERKLETSQRDAEAVAFISVDELKKYRGLWDDAGVYIPPALLDGRRSNGEIADPGIKFLAHSAFVYTDEWTNESIEIPIARETQAALIRALEPIRRMRRLNDVLAKPLSRKKVPIAVEAGAFPGFSVNPSLVPLEPDPAERRLYY